jgi:ArsR family transcriptional regulator
VSRLSLDESTELYRLLGDISRLRLLTLLNAHSLSVAELTEITGMAQSRVSTHLARLKNAGLVADRRRGAATLYSSAESETYGTLWRRLRDGIDDPVLNVDRERAEQVLLARQSPQTWAESVAGRMEAHYSPGRTWEATARASISLLDLGDTLDIASGDGVLAELLAPQARRLRCIDISPTVISAARKRLKSFTNVDFCVGDMQALPFADASFDHVFAMHALPFATEPSHVLAEAARVLRSGGRLIVASLASHQHAAARDIYDHRNLGIEATELRGALEDNRLRVESCRITSRETRPPYFEVITALAVRE